MTQLKISPKKLKPDRLYYMLFSGTNHYPYGGWDDFKGYFTSINNAKLWLQKNVPDASHKWAHIVYEHKIIMWGSEKSDRLVSEYGLWEWRLDE